MDERKSGKRVEGRVIENVVWGMLCEWRERWVDRMDERRAMEKWMACTSGWKGRVD